MDIYIIVLRLIHIFAGIFWVGSGFFMVGLFIPAMRAQGPQGGRFMYGLMKYSRFNVAMPVSSLLTTAAGVLLYWEVSDGFNADWMGSDPGIVLSIGVTAGLLAFGHGAAVTGPTAGKVEKAMDAAFFKDGPPSPEEAATLQVLGAKMGHHAMISLVLMIISVVGMASARYM